MKKMNKITAALMAAIMALSLVGCAETAVSNSYAEPKVSNGYTEPATGNAAANFEKNADAGLPDEPLQETPDMSVNSGCAGKEAASLEMDSVEAIAVLGTLTGTGKLDRYEKHDMVDVSDSHNPYDLVWQYGDRELEGAAGFGGLYQSYIDAVDWSLVFDAEYYKQAFPMLAMLYHYDDGLLLEHFQTVGVHEGRQGAEKFNVAAYMSVCGRDLTDAFGENYECYYFYYMLHYAEEQYLDTAPEYGEYQLWLGLELTRAQSAELRSVNRYRDEVGAGPLEAHPELIAFANYRAWYNAANCLAGHGWLDSDDNTDPVFDALGVDYFCENTITQKGSGSLNSSLMPYSLEYANSAPHYKSMVRDDFILGGVSHMYCNPSEGWVTQFDTFLYDCPVPWLEY